MVNSKTRLDRIIEKCINKYLAQSDVETRVNLKLKIKYALLDYEKGNLEIPKLEKMFNLSREEEEIINEMEDREKILELYHKEDRNYDQ